MKRVFVVICSLIMVASAANAQTADVTKADKAAEKAAKAKLKEKQAADIESAFKEIGITAEQAKTFKETTEVYSAKSNEVKKNTALAQDEKDKQLKAITDEKNTKLKEIIGADKYKEFNKIRKAQKEKEAAATGGGQ